MNRRHLAKIASALVLTMISVAATMARPAHALSLLGAEVHGELFINGVNINFFDPVNGKVPDVTFGNSLHPPGTGTSNVPISDPLIEFGYEGAADRFTAQFTGSGQVTIVATSVPASFTTVSMTFSSPGFVGLGFEPVSVVGTNNHCAFSMSTISCGLTPGPGFTSTYAFSTIARVPAPASLVLLAVGVVGVIAYRRKRA